MKIITTFLIVFSFSLTKTALTQEIKEANLRFDLPNDSWALANKASDKATAYVYKRKPIEDSDGHQIIPNLAVIIENVEKDLDPVLYSAMKRSQTNFEVIEVLIPEKEKWKFRNAVVYKGKYKDKYSMDHTIFIVHGVNGDKGIHIICDVTTNILDKVEDEFKSALKSLRK